MILPSVIKFEPLYCQRVWGGNAFEEVFSRALPEQGEGEEQKWGESWEIGVQGKLDSKVVGGELAGMRLSQLWKQFHQEIFGEQAPQVEQFPLLMKWLDCSQRLSVQVHPSKEQANLDSSIATKTESWYIAAANLDAELFVGLKKKLCKQDFLHACQIGVVDQYLQCVQPKEGEIWHLPSGRIHALGGGLLVAEVQQSSDTTYRLWDWGRVGLDGKPRQLHLEQGLDAVNLQDEMPCAELGGKVSCPFYQLELIELSALEKWQSPLGESCFIGVVKGSGLLGSAPITMGDWRLLTAAGEVNLQANTEGVSVLVVSWALK